MTQQTNVDQVLEWLSQQGFDEAMAVLVQDELDELNINHNEPSLLRSTRKAQLHMTGIVGGRKSSLSLTNLSDEAIQAAVVQLMDEARLAPEDAANKLSADQIAQIERGPQQGDRGVLTEKVRELLDYRATHTPTFMLEEGYAKYHRQQSWLRTTLGSRLDASIGSYGLSVFGSAKEGTVASSFNYAGGYANDIASQPAERYFGMGEMMQDTCRQVHAQPLESKFIGDVILTPNAVNDLLDWLLEQVSDYCLISESSVYRHKVGELIAAPHVNVCSYLDGAGVSPFTDDGFVAESLALVASGRLNYLLPSLYGSRKLGLTHTPCSGSAWQILPGDTPRETMIQQVKQGALVGRLSMGNPASNGDFAGVIKNSFLVKDGARQGALAEVMISGNVAQMLKNVVAVSAESLDMGNIRLPWLHVSGLSFS